MVANAGISMMKSLLDSASAPDFSPSRLLSLNSNLTLSATAEDLDRILSVNLRGTFLCYKYAGKQMIAQGRGGRIIGGLDPRNVPLVLNCHRRRMFRYRQARTGISWRVFC